MSFNTLGMTRRAAFRGLATGLAMPAVFRAHAHAAPSETLYHASIGASGMGGADLHSLTASPHVKLVAVADVDLRNTAEIKKEFPGVKIYQDWRQLLDKEKHLDSVNVSTPDHMHAPITMRAMHRGLNVYTQKPLTQTIYEARQLTQFAREHKLITQMGIQIHSHEIHRMVVATIQANAIGKVKEVHSWSGKYWGDPRPRPDRSDPVPSELNWDFWLGVAPKRSFLAGYYHPGDWRKRLDFGTGTFGDMGCHILDPVFTSLALTAPKSVRCEGGGAGKDNWGIDNQVRFEFPRSRYTTETLTLCWYDGGKRPPATIKSLIGERPITDQGSIYIGTEGVLYSPYIETPMLLPVERFKDFKLPDPGGTDHYLQFVESCRGNGKTSAGFEYAGPLTESVLLGCVATRFPGATLNWDASGLKFTNHSDANRYVRRTYRKGWEMEGL